MKSEFHHIQVPEDAELLRKEWYSYRIGHEWFDIELFENQTGQYYAIGTPADKSRIYVYGSSIVGDPTTALAQTVKKITRDQQQQDILRIGEDVRPSED